MVSAIDFKGSCFSQSSAFCHLITKSHIKHIPGWRIIILNSFPLQTPWGIWPYFPYAQKYAVQLQQCLTWTGT
ncbi:hypothetical protein AHF37_11072 [Paragonimus kellicotti]|nr:hypothetical protein AHF37_11072 [Paragonimus kellicotti]